MFRHADALDPCPPERGQASLATRTPAAARIGAPDAMGDLVSNVPCGLFTLDRRHRFLQVNDTLLDWLDRPRAELEGHRGPAEFMLAADRERFESALPALQGLGVIGGLSVAVADRHGRSRRLELTGRVQVDTQGGLVRSHWVALDRSSHPPAPASCECRADAVARSDSAGAPEADRARRELLASLSHALRTPLHQATGLVHLLERAQAEADGPRFATFLGFLDGSCRELRRRIEALLDHANRCASAPSPITVDLRAVLSPLVETLRPVARRRRLTLEQTCPPGLLAHADPERLRQAVGALLDNALAFTPDGGHVSVRAGTPDPARIRIDVEDDGIGIAAADLDRLFIEFVRLPAGEARQPDGLGLGLARCRRLIHAMGGSVDASSQPDRGSVFSILLPRQPDPSMAAGTTQRS